MFNPVLILIGLTVAISAYAWSNRDLLEAWIMEPYVMARNGQWYRLLTSGFLHADWSHLLFNMFAFYSFSPIVLSTLAQAYEPGAGLGLFLLLYLGGIVVSDLPTYFQHRDDRGYRSLGASGGVASVLFASILLFPVNTNGGGIIIFPLPVPIQPFLFGFLYLAYSYYMGRRRADNVNHDAHFYGALYGVLLIIALVPGVLPHFVQQVSAYIHK
ncbi:rhomboid family intramembrane serine protease [Hymenobacter cheonanensis]|uniref:rhomboid family intramembrane serine protease n=1 Tax=Hymenobacter sp. CA2-7 TaxID=3063993 RepID=UPI0027124BD0|nr:rhomboid family intramembrane serine protease [Hymenobacter sp. CA2-7]MDO7884859.1 rhomboid family intramembrane serine protease [Hymenobacter sp. CA2-7]